MGNKTIRRSNISSLLHDHKTALLFLFLLISAFVAISIAAFAHAEETSQVYTSGDFQYVILDEERKTGEIQKYTGKAKDLIIPSSLDGVTIESIRSYAFFENDSLQSVTIPDSVKSIGGAFVCCTSLQSVTIPNSVTDITYAFRSCSSLESVTIPDSVTCIGEGTFDGCDSLKNVTIPDSVTSIEEWAFGYCLSLQNVSIPNSVTSIGKTAFCACTSLQHITIPDSVMSIGENAFNDCESLQHVTIPIGLTRISDGVFSDCISLQSVTIPNSVTSIGNEAFRWCPSLETITIPDSVKSIGDDAFYHCVSLQNVTIPVGLTSINDYVFFDCISLRSVSIPNGVTSIGERAFEGCSSLESVTIPDSVTSIGNLGFYDCGGPLDVYYLDSSMHWSQISMGEDVFKNTDVTIHCSDGDISPNEQFDWKSMSGILRQDDNWKLEWKIHYLENENGEKTNVELSISLLGDSSAESPLVVCDDNDTENAGTNQPWLTETGLKKEDIKTLTVSGNDSTRLVLFQNYFKGYSGLREVSLTHVDDLSTGLFEDCPALSKVFVDSSLRIVRPSAFKNDVKLSVFEIEDGSEKDGTAFMSKLETIGEAAFENTAISKLYLTPSLKSVGNGAFKGCNSLKKTLFDGSPSQWKSVSVGKNNEPLLDSLAYLNSDPFYINGYKYDHNLDWFASHIDSSTFDNELCKLMCGLACVAYNNDEAPKAFERLGFPNSSLFENSFYYSTWYGDPSLKSYRINKKTTTNGIDIVLIDITGSHSPFESGTDWSVDFHVVDYNMNYNTHAGFQSCSDEVYNNLIGYLGTLPNKNTKYFITGHSLGAGTANLLASKISSEIGKEDVYCYDFACPDTVATTEDPTQTGDNNPFNKANSRDNIFNICSLADPVAYLPGEVGTWLVQYQDTLAFVATGGKVVHAQDYHWGKNGITLWYDDGKFDVIIPFAHKPEYYVDYQHKQNQPHYINSSIHPTKMVDNAVKEEIVKLLVMCPVDIDLVDDNGKVVMSIIDNQVVMKNNDTNVWTLICEDRKCICYPERENYSVKLRGSDEGSMTFIVGKGFGDAIDIEQTTAFCDVVLTKGKTMMSDPDEIDTEDTKLYVVNEDNEPVKEIHENGEETKVGVSDLTIQSILVERDEDNFVILPGSEKQIQTVFKNANGDWIEKAAVWTSSNEQIATVSETGLVTAISEGKATITVSVDNQTMEIPITVSSRPVEPITEKDEPTTNKDTAPSTTMLNGIVKGPDGKWAMYKNNKVDTSYTGIAKNQYGWWRIEKGYVNFKANGIYKNQYGWWKTTDGKVTFKETGVFKNEYGWWRVENSKVNFKANGIYKNQYGWWKTTNGKVTFKENGVFKNEYGWWKVKDSKVDFNFTGIAKNKYGRWYVKNGKVDFSKNGKVTFNNQTYTIKSGKVL